MNPAVETRLFSTLTSVSVRVPCPTKYEPKFTTAEFESAELLKEALE